MSSEYQRVLHEWARREIPEAVTIENVMLDYEPGAQWEYTIENPRFDIVIRYTVAGGEEKWHYIDEEPGITQMGELLTKLFAIADEETP